MRIFIPILLLMGVFSVGLFEINSLYAIDGDNEKSEQINADEKGKDLSKKNSKSKKDPKSEGSSGSEKEKRGGRDEKDREQTKYTKSQLLKPLPTDIVLGCDNAPKTIIEYSSYVCPHCSSYHANIFPKIKKKLIDTCKVKYIYREYPAKQAGLDAAVLSRCFIENKSNKEASADKKGANRENTQSSQSAQNNKGLDKSLNDRFYDFVNLLFYSQKNWAFEIKYRDKLKEIAKMQGIDDAEFDSCIARSDIADNIINIAYQSTLAFDITYIPLLLLDGKKIDANNFEDVLGVVEGRASKAKIKSKP